MIPHPHIIPKVWAATLGAVGIAATATSFTEDHINFTQLLVGGILAVVAATVGVMTWIDLRMDKKVGDSEKRILAKIKHLHELLEEKGILHTRPVGSDDVDV